MTSKLIGYNICSSNPSYLKNSNNSSDSTIKNSIKNVFKDDFFENLKRLIHPSKHNESKII